MIYTTIMTQVLYIHPDNPQARLVTKAAEVLQRGGVIVYPTSAGYAMACRIGDKDAINRIRRIRDFGKDHNFTLMCRDLSEISTYARVDNPTFRSLKAHTPGPYTFILEGTREVPKRLLHAKRKTIGIRVSAHPVTQLLLEHLDEPFLTVSVQSQSNIEEGELLFDIDEIIDHLDGQVDVIINAQSCGIDATSIIDFTGPSPVVVRQGVGDVSAFDAEPY